MPVSEGRVELIQVEVALLDAFGNHACNALMSAEECIYINRGWEAALTLHHNYSGNTYVNYTSDDLSRETRTASRPLVFEDGKLRARFDYLRVFRAPGRFSFDASLLLPPFDTDAQGVPLKPSELPVIRSSTFDTILRNEPVTVVFVSHPPPVSQSACQRGLRV